MNHLKAATLLAIDDDMSSLFLLDKLLTDKCKKLWLENNPTVALNLIHERQPDLILLDVFIDEENGIEVCKQLKANPQIQHIPVIFLSASSSQNNKVEGFRAGGVDYITKPFDIDEVLVRIESCLTTHKKILQLPPVTPEENPLNILQNHFNPRELEIVHLYVQGHKRCDIAAKIAISENTVKWYLKQIFQKLEVNNRADLIAKVQLLAFKYRQYQ